MKRDTCTLTQALFVAKTGAIGAVDVSEPWVHDGSEASGAFALSRTGQTTVAPGLVDLEYLRSLHGVRAWRAEDAR